MASPAAILDVVVKANTAPATSGLKKFDASLHKVDASAKKATTTTDKLDTANRNIGQSFLTAAKYAAGAAGAYVGIAQAKAAVSTTTDLAKATLTLNKNLGLSIKTSSEFAAVAKARGVDTRQLGQAFGTLSRQVEAAKKGTESSVTAFKALGITARDLKSQSINQTIMGISDGMAALGEGTQRTQISMQLFSRGWQALGPILRDGSASLKEQLALADKYGASFSGKSVKSIEDLIASERELKIAQLGLQVQFTKFIAPALISVFLKFAELINKVRTAKKAIEEFVRDVVAAFKNFWQKSEILRSTVTKAFDAIKTNFKGLKEFITGTVKVISGVLTGDFGEAWDGVKDIFKSGVKSILSVVKLITAPLRAAVEKIAEMLKSVFGDAWDAVTGLFEDAANTLLGTMHRLTNTINKGFEQILGLTNSALKAFGVKPLAFSLAGAVAEGAAQGKQKGGVIHAARGRMVPGRGSGDKVPAMLEPGEVVLNRKAVAAMGGARRANRINRMIPRFATGGVIEQALGPYSIPPIAYDPNHAGGNSHLHLDFFNQAQAITYGKKMQSMGWNIGEYSGPYGGFGPITTTHQSPGHYDGTAFDANTASDETKSEVAAVARLLTGKGGVVGAVAEKIRRVLLKGPDGPLKSLGQAALDKVRGAANAYVSKRGGTTTSMDAGASIKGLPRSLAKWNKQYPYDSADAMPVSAVKSLASWQGLPDWFYKIAQGESAFQPGAVGHDPGGTTGYGLYQETDPFANTYVKAVTGGLDYNKMLNPVLNTMAAKLHFQAAPSQTPGTPGFPWYGTQYLQSGGIVGGAAQHFAKGGKVKPSTYTPTMYSPSAMGHGGQTYKPGPPSIALQFAQLDLAMANAAGTLDVADDRAVLDQRALLVQRQIRKVSNALSKKGLSAARRLALTQKLADLKGQLNSIASDQQALYPSDFSAGGNETITDTAAADAAAADAAAQQALTEAMKALTAELAQQNALVNGALASDYTQALAYIGDLLNGAIGGQVAPRLSTAGSGSVVRY